MDDNLAAVREYLMAGVQTRREDMQRYMFDMAAVHRDAADGSIDLDTYRTRMEDVERRYADRVFEGDCRTFYTVDEYRGFFTLLKRLAPDCSDALDHEFEHELEHAAALEGDDRVQIEYCFWLLREPDGSVSGLPSTQIRTRSVSDYLDARKRSVGAPHDLSDHDAVEAGRYTGGDATDS